MLAGLAYARPTLLVLLLADRAIQRALDHRAGASPAARVVDAAQVFAVFLLAIALAAACVADAPIGTNVQWLLLHGGVALLALELATWLGVRLLARGAVRGEVARGNLAAATFGAGHVVATGILAASNFGGTSLDQLWLALSFFALGQLSLHLLVGLFRALTTYDDAAQALAQNHGAALAHAGLSVAMAILIAHAADGPFPGALASLQAYGLALLKGVLLYVVRQGIVECVLLRARPCLRGGALDRAIGEHGGERFWHGRGRWVLKSDFGCEGSDVVIGAAVTADEWDDALAHAIAQRWVAQRWVAQERRCCAFRACAPMPSA